MDIATTQTHIEAARQLAMVLAASGRLPVSARDAADIHARLSRHLQAALAALGQDATVQAGAA